MDLHSADAKADAGANGAAKANPETGICKGLSRGDKGQPTTIVTLMNSIMSRGAAKAKPEIGIYKGLSWCGKGQTTISERAAKAKRLWRL